MCRRVTNRKQQEDGNGLVVAKDHLIASRYGGVRVEECAEQRIIASQYRDADQQQQQLEYPFTHCLRTYDIWHFMRSLSSLNDSAVSVVMA